MLAVKHTDVWDLCKKPIDCIWKAEDIDLSRDYIVWLILTSNERHFIKMGPAFFASSDNDIIESSVRVSRFMVEIQSLEMCAFLSIQSFMENMHPGTHAFGNAQLVD